MSHSLGTMAGTSNGVLRWSHDDSSLNNHDSEELDDDLADLPSFNGADSGSKADRVIRRRSSKACDQCRKSKCKCERTGNNQPCRSCVVLGTECTFLGPSRKRGPPKGYIDAIESRLHQLEALLGIIISSQDTRAQSLVEDLSQDTLARDIIARVDNSPFGPRGRRLAVTASRDSYLQDDGQPSPSARSKRHVASRYALDLPQDGSLPAFITPSNEWQDHLASRVSANGRARQSALPPLQVDLGSFAAAYPESASAVDRSTLQSALHPSIDRPPPPLRTADIHSGSGTPSPRRTRRRTDQYSGHRDWSVSPPSAAADEFVHSAYPSTPSDSETGDDDLAGAVGQLSLDDHEQVRFHGKASGLHLLGKGDRRDKRIENGLWRFPPARVWPLAPSHVARSEEEVAARARLPPHDVQQHLIELYFAYVHPVIPLLCKSSFLDAFYARGESPPAEDGQSPASMQTTSSRRTSQRAPTLLLLAMFALASRFTTRETPIPTDSNNMWEAGDQYLEDAKLVLNQVYASSRPTTCQALLLLAYREIGIGAMAQSWLYTGMAIRMAQDLGLHRFVDKWQRGGTRLFTQDEIQLRRRIWHACVVMDRYVSTYIGRPLGIDEREFDTPLPAEVEQEEQELWENHPSLKEQEVKPEYAKDEYCALPGRPIATFNAAASLACIIGSIVQCLYSVRHGNSSISTTAVELEKKLDMWWIDLPDQLRYDPAVRRLPIPPPHILTLHMNHWTAVLLLHRPFIAMKHAVDGNEDPASAKAWDLCVSAATHISTLVKVYRENFCLKRGATFLSYYIFSAGIMHVTTLTKQPGNVQANIGLQVCMEALKYMDRVWPSAGRAWELLHGSNVEIRAAELAALANQQRVKRAATNDLVDTDDAFRASSATAITQPPMSVRAPPLQPPGPPLQHVAGATANAGYEMTPTTASSADSFFGPYMRWSQSEMFHPGPAPASSTAAPPFGTAHTHVQHHHHHSHPHHPHSHAPRQQSMLSAYAQQAPSSQQQQQQQDTRYNLYNDFSMSQDPGSYNDSVASQHALYGHPNTLMAQQRSAMPLNAPLGTAPPPTTMPSSAFSFTPQAQYNPGGMLYSSQRLTSGVEHHE
ncbi:fungal-specific transcription factor domain-containing protein [Auriculariales sp. MPI-PUGE-AT-0066]|nr:fungal-specific transcription factor domain-containing protein [Auriculariales sp. MPI-PUGE-AT-0066]